MLLIALAGGFFVGRESVPGVPVVASETVAMSSSGAAPLTVDTAALVAHTWGVELRISGSGFAKGEVFQAAFQDRSGAWVPAGEFLGTGAATLTCNLQAGRLRDDVVAVQITDQAGETVLASSL